MSFSVGLLKEALKDPAATWAAGGVKPGSQKKVVLAGTGLLPSEVTGEQLGNQVVVLTVLLSW